MIDEGDIYVDVLQCWVLRMGKGFREERRPGWKAVCAWSGEREYFTSRRGALRYARRMTKKAKKDNAKGSTLPGVEVRVFANGTERTL